MYAQVRLVDGQQDVVGLKLRFILCLFFNPWFYMGGETWCTIIVVLFRYRFLDFWDRGRVLVVVG